MARIAIAAALALVAASCGDDDAADPAETVEGAAPDVTVDEGETDGEPAGGAEGDCAADPEVVAAAEEEGEVVLFGGGHTREGAELVASMFEERYGIPVTVNRQPTGDIIQQVEASIEAGAVAADVVSLADVSTFIRWTEEAIIVDAEVPNLDEVVEGIVDPSRPSFPYAVTPLGFVYNSANLEASEVPTSWEGMTSIEGRILAHADPAQSGTALGFMYMARQVAGEDYYQGFADDEILVTDSSLALNQLVLSGEADFAAPAIETEVERAQAAGEPLEMIYPEEAVPMFTAELAVLAQAPHPNAGKLLAQYHLCEEFQQAIAEIGARPALTGVPAPEGVPDLSDREVVTVDVAELGEQREALIQQFNAVATG